MSDRWFVRVGGKEYGPVDFEILAVEARGALVARERIAPRIREHVDDGRRRSGIVHAPTAAAEHAAPSRPAPQFAELIGDSLRIYKSAFLPFLFVTLLVSVPILLLELTSPAYWHFPQAARRPD